MTPSVSIDKTDGNIGSSSDTERILAIIGPASAGPTNVGVSVTNKSDLTDTFQDGRLVEAGAYMLARGIPIVAFRGVPTTDGAYSTVAVTDVTGTSVVTAGSTKPRGSFDVIVEILTGGDVGTAGIVYRYSMDNGVNWSAPQSLGAVTTLPCDGGVSFALSNGGSPAKTLLTGDRWSVSTTGPKLLTADLATSLAALKDYSGEWLRVLVLTEADATIIAQCESFADSFHAEGKNPEVVTCTRPRGATEDRPAYQTAMAAIAAAVQTTETSPCVDECEVVSEVSGRRLRMPTSIPYAARLMLIDDSQDAAAKADGALPGVFLETAAGVKKYHDERKYPGLDALGFTTLRTWGGRPVTPGAYVNNPRLLSGAGSDFRYFQHSALLNRAIEKTFKLLEPRLSQGVLCDPTTGRIRADVATSIEEAINGELRTEFQDPARCSAIQFALSRTDNVLSTDTLSFSVQMVPLAYVKKFLGKAGLAKTLAVTPNT